MNRVAVKKIKSKPENKKKKKKGKLLELPIPKNIRLKIAKLSWQILEHKFKYYMGSAYGIKSVPDHIYDEVEDKYKKLCKKYGVEPTASSMVDFDVSKPSCKLVKEYMIATKGKGNVQEVRKKVNVFQGVLKEVLDEVSLDEKVQKKIRIKIKKRFKV